MSSIKAENKDATNGISPITTNDTRESSFHPSNNMTNQRLQSLPTPASTLPTTIITPARHNISVTNIKCEIDDNIGLVNGNIVAATITQPSATMNFSHANNSNIAITHDIRIPITKTEDSDSDAELSNIENLKVTRRTTSRCSSISTPTESHNNKNIPRPMSWEGELSETEINETDELMETDGNSIPATLPSDNVRSIGVAVIKSEATTTTPNTKQSLHNRLMIACTSIKPDLEQSASQTVIYPKLRLAPTQIDAINLKYESDAQNNSNSSISTTTQCTNSPLMSRNKTSNLPLPANPSPDSAIHSVYTHSSPSQSPLTSRHAPYTPSLSRNNSDASHSSCYSYSSEFSPTNSPIQGRHTAPASSIYGNFNNSLHHNFLYRPIAVESASALSNLANEAQNLSMDAQGNNSCASSTGPEGLPSPAAGISRQQLINSPCPICGDKISGFHYGIFSCESCKGFFKRTVQNRKNYVCVRGGPCPVSTATRKKCPACRFEKCLQKGMKLEAIREDRTRGGRSTYQCTYTLPNTMLSPLLSPEQKHASNAAAVSAVNVVNEQQQQAIVAAANSTQTLNGYAMSGGGGAIQPIKSEGVNNEISSLGSSDVIETQTASVPILLQEIMDVEHLWQYNEAELARINQPLTTTSASTSSANAQMTNPLLASAGLSSNGENTNPDLIAHLCNVADHRLYKIVKWCKSLPLFKNISIDDQICLLINSWCELLLFSCCFRSIDTPGEIKMSQGKKISLQQAKSSGLQACIERMLNLTDHLRRLRVDRYEYVAMKVIVLLQSDTSELQEPVKVRECQEKALQSLQAYILTHYPDAPSKFGELLLRIPDLQRTCQLGKEMLTIKSRDGGDFNLLMELLRGEH